MSHIFTLEKLFRAYNDARKGKSRTANAIIFELDREKNLVALLEELSTRTYVPSRHIYFIVTRPVPREIFAADFRDRVIHHLFYNEIAAFCDRCFNRHSYANRLGKGTHAAVRTVREFVRHNPDGYYLKLDVRSFFPSINRAILSDLVERDIRLCASMGMKGEKWEKDMLWLARSIISVDPTRNFIYKGDLALKKLILPRKSLFHSGVGKGLPIGNLTSQFFANLYMDELDCFVTGALACRNYARYVDDFIIVDSDRAALLSRVGSVREFLKRRLDLDLHPDKIRFQHVSKGVDFLGYFIKPTHTLVRQSIVRRFKDKLRRCQDVESGLFPASSMPMIQSYLGHFGHANAFNLTKKLVLSIMVVSFGILMPRFVDAASSPVVAAPSVVSATTSAVFSGSITDTGGSTVTARGFVIGPTASYGNTTTENGTWSVAPAAYTATGTDMICGTQYHYAAYATNGQGTAYSGDQTFVTASCPVYHLATCPTSTDLVTDMNNEIDARIMGTTYPADATTNVNRDTTFMKIWSVTGNDQTGSDWIINPLSWVNFTDALRNIAPLDFSGVTGEPYTGLHGTLVDPQHLVIASHTGHYSNGTEVVFVNANHQIATTTILASAAVPGNLDITVKLLASPIPNYIPYYPVLPDSSFNAYMRQATFPLAIKDIKGEMVVRDITSISLNPQSLLPLGTSNTSSVEYPFSLEYNTNGTCPGQGTLTSYPQNGDSGNPGFYIIGGKPVLQFLYWTCSGGNNYGHYMTQIDQTISDLDNQNLADHGASTGYQLSTMDMSCFAPPVPISLPTQTLTIPENSPSGTVVGSSIISGTKYKAPLTYSIQSGNTNIAFNINGTTGVITVNNQPALNYANNPVFNLLIKVTDSGSPQTTASAVTTIQLTSNPNNSPPASPSSAGTVIPANFSWAQRASLGAGYQQIIASSADGTRLIASGNGNYLSTSTDSGATWTQITAAGSHDWVAVASSADGTRLSAVDGNHGGYIYTSSGGGTTWATAVAPGSQYLTAIASSANGMRLAAADRSPGHIYISTDGGATWVMSAAAGSHPWVAVATSADGMKLTAVESGGGLYVSSDGGTSWNETNYISLNQYVSVASSADGTKLAVATDVGYIYTSLDGGATWKSRSFTGLPAFQGVVSSADGTRFAAIDGNYGGYIYVSSDAGTTWATTTAPNSPIYYKSIASSADGTRLIVSSLYYGVNYIYVLSSALVATQTLSAPSASSVSSSGATLSGSITFDGGGASTARGFYWGTATSYGNTTVENGIFGISTFSTGISGLSSCTTYHVAAYSTNYVGTATSPNASFVTLGCVSASYGVGGGGGGGGAYVAPVIAKAATTTSTIPIIPVPGCPPGFSCRLASSSFVPVISAASSTPPTFLADLSVGSSGSDVKALQIFLNSSGFAVAATGPGSPGNETTLFGSLTEAAVRAFQTAYGITPTGEIGPITRAFIASFNSKTVPTTVTPSVAVFSNETTSATSSYAASSIPSLTRSLYFGLTGSDVRALQVFLNSHGFIIASTGIGSPGHETGLFGFLTEAAVKAFQSANGIDPNGTVGPVTRAAIAELLKLGPQKIE